MKTMPELVSRFLSWPLPDDVCVDSCAQVQGYPGRTGTTLLTATQADQMLRHVLGNETLAAAVAWVEKRRDDFTAEHGSTDPDTGAQEFGSGMHAQAKTEYVGELEEIIEGLRSLAEPALVSG